MRKNISAPVAGAVLFATLCGLLVLGWRWMGSSATTQDVRPIIREMNQGKPLTEPIDPGHDMLLMGSKNKKVGAPPPRPAWEKAAGKPSDQPARP